MKARINHSFQSKYGASHSRISSKVSNCCSLNCLTSTVTFCLYLSFVRAFCLLLELTSFFQEIFLNLFALAGLRQSFVCLKLISILGISFFDPDGITPRIN